MLYLLVVSAILLPCVLGNCCMPDEYTGIYYNTREPNRAVRILTSFKDMRVLRADVNQSMPVEYELFDLNNDLMYTKRRNAGCSIKPIPLGAFDTLHQCTDSGNDKGSFEMGNGMKVLSYEFIGRRDEIHVVYSKDKCLPMIGVSQDHNMVVSTNVYGNLQYENVDTSELHPDLSNCFKDAEEV